MDYLIRACEFLEISKSEVLAHKIYESEIVLIIDKGIAGAPKVAIPLSALEQAPEEAAASPLEDLNYRELQALAKESGISASQRKADLIEALEALEEEE